MADTNVLSGPLRRDPDPGVLAWLSAHEADIAVTTITVADFDGFGVGVVNPWQS